MPDLSKYKDTYQNFPQLSSIKMLWHSGYWDGPLSGMCSVAGEKYWFECIEQWDDKNSYPEDDDDFYPPWYRRYLIWKLDPEQQVTIESRHLKFQTMVGTHTDYNESGQRSHFRLSDKITQETVNQYYEEAKLEKRFDLIISDESIIGWFER